MKVKFIKWNHDDPVPILKIVKALKDINESKVYIPHTDAFGTQCCAVAKNEQDAYEVVSKKKFGLGEKLLDVTDVIAQVALDHCKKNGRKNKILEEIILADLVAKSDPRWAYEYALNVIKGRWKEAEKIISTHPEYAYSYARNIIKGRWKKAEPIIADDPIYAFEYALNIIKGKLPELMHNKMMLHGVMHDKIYERQLIPTIVIVKKYMSFINN